MDTHPADSPRATDRPTSGQVARRTRRRRALWIAGVCGVIVVAAALYLGRALSFAAPEEFWTQKGELIDVQVEPVAGDTLMDAFTIILESDAGYRVRGHLRLPTGEGGPWPALIILGGIDTGRMAAQLVTPERPHAILGLDYPWEGSTRLSAAEFLLRVLAVRRAMLLTPSAVFLAIDYLELRDDVRGHGIVLTGASFGAQLATVSGALDPRVGPVILAYGGGDFEALIRANLEDDMPGWLATGLARAGAWLIRPLEPLQYIGRVAPDPVIMINGNRDHRIPRYCVEVLYSAAESPKRLIWLDEGHISSRDQRLLRRVLDAATEALTEVSSAAASP